MIFHYLIILTIHVVVLTVHGNFHDVVSTREFPMSVVNVNVFVDGA